MNQSKILFWSITVALAGFLFGFDTVVISGAEKSLSEMWGHYTLFGSASLFHGVVVMSSALWGTVIGAMFGSWPTDSLGRKKTLIIIGVLYTVSAVGSALVSDPWSFAFFRFIGGLGVGGFYYRGTGLCFRNRAAGASWSFGGDVSIQHRIRYFGGVLV